MLGRFLAAFFRFPIRVMEINLFHHGFEEN